MTGRGHDKDEGKEESSQRQQEFHLRDSWEASLLVNYLSLLVILISLSEAGRQSTSCRKEENWRPRSALGAAHRKRPGSALFGQRPISSMSWAIVAPTPIPLPQLPVTRLEPSTSTFAISR